MNTWILLNPSLTLSKQRHHSVGLTLRRSEAAGERQTTMKAMFELGVGTSLDFTNLGALKRAALLVDSLLVVPFDPTTYIVFTRKGENADVPAPGEQERRRWERKRSHLEAELEWLTERGFIRTLRMDFGGQGGVSFGERSSAVELRFSGTEMDNVIAACLKTDNSEPSVRTPRVIAAGLRSAGIDAVPLYASSGARPATPVLPGLDSVVRATLKMLPEPEATTPWDVIFEFRDDRKTHELRVRFMRLLRKIAKADVTQREAEEALLESTFEYETHLRSFHLRSSTTGLEALFSIPFEIAEDLVKIKWSSAVRRLFALKHTRGELLQNELNAPGREIAYLLHARRVFRGDPP